MINEKAFKKISFFIVIAILAVLTFMILEPIAISMIFGLILAFVFYPVYSKILSVFKEKNISALIVILLVIFVIFLPLWFLLPFVFRQLFDLYLYAQKINFVDVAKGIVPGLTEISVSSDILTSLNTFVTNFVSKLFSSVSSHLLNLPSVALKLVVVMFVFFFGMRDAEIFVSYVKSLSPFSEKINHELSKKFKNMTMAVIYGLVVVGIIQGLVAGFGLFIFGVPHYLLLTILAILLSVIPFVGAWLIWIPASIYLIASGKVILGIGLFIYSAIIVSWIDNIIKPYLVAKRTNIHSAIIIIGMIGGMIVFGALGLILGPLILSYLLLIIEAYRDKKLKSLFSK